MPLPARLKKAEPNAPSNDRTSTEPADIPPSVRRSGRHAAKPPVTYYQRAKRGRRNANPPAKRQKISDVSPPGPSKNSPPAIPGANHNPILNTPPNAIRTNLPNTPPVVTKGNNNISSTHLQTTPRMAKRNSIELSPALYSRNPFYQSPGPAPQIAPGNETSPHCGQAGIPSFTPIQIQDLLCFNSDQISYGNLGPLPKPSLPTEAEKMPISTDHLRALVCAAASHYASLPRDYGDLESCLPHLYKTFLPTANFEKWVKESEGVLGERDTHVVLMKVFEVVFSGWFSCVEAEEQIWEWLGFEEEGEEEDEGGEDGEGGEKGEEGAEEVEEAEGEGEGEEEAEETEEEEEEGAEEAEKEEEEEGKETEETEEGETEGEEGEAEGEGEEEKGAEAEQEAEEEEETKGEEAGEEAEEEEEGEEGEEGEEEAEEGEGEGEGGKGGANGHSLEARVRRWMS